MASCFGENVPVNQAKDYGDCSKFSQLLYGKKLIESIQLKETDHVAAIGCGTGELAAFVAAEKVPNGKVVALDPDSERIRVAKERYGNISNLFFHVGTSGDILRNKDEFDAIYSNVVLHWIPVAQRLETFEAIYLALKPGGVTLHNVGNYQEVNKDERLIKLLLEQKIMNPLSSKVFLFTQEELEDIATKCRFEILHLENVVEESIFPTVDDYLTWLAATCQGLIKADIKNNAMVRGAVNDNEDGTVTEVTPMTRFVFRKCKQRNVSS